MRLRSPWHPHLPPGDTPPAERLADALAGDILGEKLDAGDRLPAHRDLAWQLGIGVGSVTRAYAMLERRGLVRSVRGRGMFVASRPGGSGQMIDLSANMPPPMFGNRALARTLGRLAHTVDPALFNVYPPVAGHIEHRRIMGHWLAELGVDMPPDRLLLTSGAQQALGVAVSVCRTVRTTAVTEELAYPGMLSLLRQAGLPPHGLPMDRHGLLPAPLDRMLQAHGPGQCVVYVTPTMHNPTTATMDHARRQDIVRICQAHDALIIEDDVYDCARDDLLPPLVTLAPDRTFYVNSLSKTLSPGLRIGTLAPPARFMPAAREALLNSSLMIAPLSYAMMAQWMLDGTATSVRQALRGEAERRRGLALRILGPDLTPPAYDAFHAWMPMSMEQAADFVSAAAREDVRVTPLSPFVATPDTCGQGGIRLCLGPATLPDLTDALRRLRHVRTELHNSVT
ncbi:aminotransferase-like domain-containing protein [Komagataeibacter oboediens]|uniref:PLP-dependent aminotransferase family protein n=1 Tax=Komagataeibacter oboediens TaxID=65958 RepID=A0ABS5SMW2_9PROT|nr:PLP-dependent aminotransferase family protein [Komagataeibacter oboediens]MBL7234841.1 PLP-dependent aminotransferase family protein [Komagataeibacter oboediens]MBT0675611.1 PLP-dependent aminotransferase family protein [Komagataeibacter oboediens]MBT0679104.1 PLP-dependent aminotransferase family protein [Komagataeibacter oboediens]